MALGPHAAFIIAAWVITVGVLAATVAWVMLDYRRQQQILADLEQRGVTRRSAAVNPAAARESA